MANPFQFHCPKRFSLIFGGPDCIASAASPRSVSLVRSRRKHCAVQTKLLQTCVLHGRRICARLGTKWLQAVVRWHEEHLHPHHYKLSWCQDTTFAAVDFNGTMSTIICNKIAFFRSCPATNTEFHQHKSWFATRELEERTPLLYFLKFLLGSVTWSEEAEGCV